MNDSGTIVLVLAGVVGLILLFAQAKLFSIDAHLKKIRELLEEKHN